LAALGLPGLANADAQKMTPEQIRAWVQQSVKNKTPLQAQQIVNKLNVVPTADTPAAATPAPTATPAPVKAEPASPTVDPSVARKAVSTLPPGGASKPAPVADPTPAPVVKAEPKDEPTPQSVKAEPKDEPTPQSVKAEPKDAPRNDVSQNTNLSEFSIKGLRFGMTKDQVAEVLKQNNIGGNLGQGLGRFFGALSGANQSNTVDINFGSLLGVSEGTGMMGELEFSNDGHLHAIMLTPRTDKVAEIAQRLAMKYGQPEVEDKVWQNKIGNKFDNKVYRWKDVGGASIGAILRGNDRDYGMIGIVDSTRLKDAHAKDAENIKKSQGDFE
jgi:hypothetical protein